jgi:hypothetical protein
MTDPACPKCARPTKTLVKVKCRACYQRERWETRPPAKCHPERKDYSGGWCRTCYRDGARAAKAECHPDRLHVAKGLCAECYRELPENKQRQARVRRLRKYGLSEETFSALLGSQGGVCAICKIEEPTAVDHDHSTGQVRGLLCHLCNAGLGHFQDDIGRLDAAKTYLTNKNKKEAHHGHRA